MYIHLYIYIYITLNLNLFEFGIYPCIYICTYNTCVTAHTWEVSYVYLSMYIYTYIGTSSVNGIIEVVATHRGKR